MKSNNIFINRDGITLIELLIVIPLISIILLLVFNMFFLSTRSFKHTNNSFVIAEDIRSFTNSIQKEVNQAIKANDHTAIYKPDNTGNNELYIYTDLDGDDIPELVRYKLIDNKIYKGIEKATNTKYYLTFGNSFKNEKIVLTNVVNTGIFGDINRVEEHKGYIDDNDHRRKVNIIVEVKENNEDMPIIIDTLLVVKSRAQYGD